jgi:hypothetical protein
VLIIYIMSPALQFELVDINYCKAVCLKSIIFINGKLRDAALDIRNLQKTASNIQ